MEKSTASEEQFSPLHTDSKSPTGKVKQSNLSDILMAFGLIGSLMLFIYLTPAGTYNWFTLMLLFLIIIPTIIALITGAPFVPTPMQAVERILKAADIKPGEKVYDIGCGDGRMVHLAAKKYQANATGLELSPLVYGLAKIRQLIWRSKAKIKFGDFRYQNLKDADVIVCYLLPGPLAKLQEKLDKELKKGARVVSYAFRIGTWQETTTQPRDPENNIAPIWVYEK